MPKTLKWYRVYFKRPDVYGDTEVFSFYRASSEEHALEQCKKKEDAIDFRVEYDKIYNR